MFKTWGHFGGNNNFVGGVWKTIPVLLVGKGVPESPTNVRLSVESKRQPPGRTFGEVGHHLPSKDWRVPGLLVTAVGEAASRSTNKKATKKCLFIFFFILSIYIYMFIYHFKSITPNVCHSLICSQVFFWIVIPKMFTSKVFAKGVSCLRQGRNIWHRAFLACLALFKLVPLQIEWMCPSSFFLVHSLYLP